MASDSTGKASAGDPFRPPPATIWNSMIDAGRAFSNSQLGDGSSQPIRPRPTDIIRIKNTSGAARRRGEILRIDGKAIDTVTAEHIWLTGVVTTADGYFGILRDPVQDTEIAPLQVDSACMALVEITDIAHKSANVTAGNYVLQSAESGPIDILFAPDGLGEKECAVRFSGGSGGGTHQIEFTAVDAICDQDTGEVTMLIATVDWYSPGCTARPPGMDSYDQVEIYPACDAFQMYTTDFLMTASGKATWMYPWSGVYCVPQWRADFICGSPECD
jgi:hypothetical protein